MAKSKKGPKLILGDIRNRAEEAWDHRAAQVDRMDRIDDIQSKLMALRCCIRGASLTEREERTALLLLVSDLSNTLSELAGSEDA